jgi:hypothetical protein
MVAGTPHLHGPLADVEILADFLVLFPIFLLTDFGAVHGGSACPAAGKDRDICRYYSLACEAGLGHGSPWVGVSMNYDASGALQDEIPLEECSRIASKRFCEDRLISRLILIF